jgi:hypothetical protein
MIHVDVNRDREHPERDDYLVQVSTDGGGWRTLYVCPTTSGDAPALALARAEDTARSMIVAWTYAGLECRGTSRGYAL